MNTSLLQTYIDNYYAGIKTKIVGVVTIAATPDPIIDKLAELLKKPNLNPPQVHAFYNLLLNATSSNEAAMKCLESLKTVFLSNLLGGYKANGEEAADIRSLLFDKNYNGALTKQILHSLLRFNEFLSHTARDATDHYHSRTNQTELKYAIIDLFRVNLVKTPGMANDITDIMVSKLKKIYRPSFNDYYHIHTEEQNLTTAIELLQFLNSQNILNLPLKVKICEDSPSATNLMIIHQIKEIGEGKRSNAISMIERHYGLETGLHYLNNFIGQKEEEKSESSLTQESYALLTEAGLDSESIKAIVKRVNSEKFYVALKRLHDNGILDQDNFEIICRDISQADTLAAAVIMLYHNAIDTSYHKLSVCDAHQYAIDAAIGLATLSHAGDALLPHARSSICHNANKLDKLYVGIKSLKKVSMNAFHLGLLLDHLNYSDKLANAIILWEDHDKKNWRPNPWLVDWNNYFPELKPEHGKPQYRYTDEATIPSGYYHEPAVNCLPYAEEVALALTKLYGNSNSNNEEVECNIYYTISALTMIKAQNPSFDTRKLFNEIFPIIHNQLNSSSNRYIPFYDLLRGYVSPLHILNNQMTKMILQSDSDAHKWLLRLFEDAGKKNSNILTELNDNPEAVDGFGNLMYFILKNLKFYNARDYAQSLPYVQYAFKAPLESNNIVAAMDKLASLHILYPTENTPPDSHFSSFKFLLSHAEYSGIINNVLDIYINNSPALEQKAEFVDEKIEGSEVVNWDVENSPDAAVLKEFSQFLPASRRADLLDAFNAYKTALQAAVMDVGILPELTNITMGYVHGARIFTNKPTSAKQQVDKDNQLSSGDNQEPPSPK